MTRAESSTDKIPAKLAPPSLPDPANIALFLDVDGTLVDFAERPDAVVVNPSLPRLLHTLSRRLDGALALLSGRALREIDTLLDHSRGAAAGLHGAEMRHADGVAIATMPAPAAAELARLRDRAAALLACWPGVFIETKPNAIALHYRDVPDAAAAVRAAGQMLLREAGIDYVLQPGSHVVELKPRGADKGTALATLMHGEPFARRIPWMLGDDLTDEHAFEMATAFGGVGVIIGPRRPTCAHYVLPSPHAARAWLAALDACGETPAKTAVGGKRE